MEVLWLVFFTFNLLIYRHYMDQTSPSSDEQQPKPYLSSTYMVLPDNVQDWKVTTDRNQNIYYCEVDNKWYFAIQILRVIANKYYGLR